MSTCNCSRPDRNCSLCHGTILGQASLYATEHYAPRYGEGYLVISIDKLHSILNETCSVKASDICYNKSGGVKHCNDSEQTRMD